MTEPTAETVRNVAQAKLKYWTEETATAASVLRQQAQSKLVDWEQALLLYNRCYRHWLAAQAALDNLPRAGGVR